MSLGTLQHDTSYLDMAFVSKEVVGVVLRVAKAATDSLFNHLMERLAV